MATSSLEKRRKIRALEARRDALMKKRTDADGDLKKVRVELKHLKKLKG